MFSAILEFGMADRLWPEGFIFTTGPLEGSRSTECSICTEPLPVDGAVLTHKLCMNSICAEDILAWKTQQGEEITCPLCRGDLGELRPIGYDPKLALTMLARDGLADMNWLVGEVLLNKAPLRDRLGSDDDWHVDELCLPDTRYHPIMVGLHNQEVLEAYRKPDGERDTDSIQIEKALKLVAASILQDWHDVEGIRFLQQYYFPEEGMHTRILVPIKPEILAYDGIDILRKVIARVRSHREAKGSERWAPGWWLKRTMTSAQLAASPALERLVDDAFSRVITQTGQISSKERNGKVQWMLWQLNEPNRAMILACPIWRVTTKAKRYQGRTVWSFHDNDGKPVCSVKSATLDGALNDPQIYDFTGCIDDYYEGEGATIDDGASRPVTDAELLNDQGLDDLTQMAERVQLARSILSQISAGRFQVPPFPFELEMNEPPTQITPQLPEQDAPAKSRRRNSM